MGEHFEVSVSLDEWVGADPKQMLATAVGLCLASSLKYCLDRAHIETDNVSCVVTGEVTRNEHGRLRITELRAQVHPLVGEDDAIRLTRCGTLFEDFCTVTSSVRGGIDVQVEVSPVTSAPVIACGSRLLG